MNRFSLPGQPTGQPRTGWAVAGTLQTGDPNGTISCQASFDQAEMFTVQANLTPPSVANGCIPKLTIIYSVNGVPVTRVIDCASGTSISGCGEAIRAFVVDATPSTVSIGQKYQVELTIGKFPRPGVSTPILTGLRSTQLTSGATTTVTVPGGANGFIVYASGSGLSIEAQETVGVPPLVLADTNVIPGTVYPLLGGTTQVTLKNNGSSNAQVALCWTIDG